MKFSIDAVSAHADQIFASINQLSATKARSLYAGTQHGPLKLEYSIASYPIFDIDDDLHYDDDVIGRHTEVRVISLDQHAQTLDGITVALYDDMLSYSRTLQEASSKELAIGSTFTLIGKGDRISFFIGQYDLKLKSSADPELISYIKSFICNVDTGVYFLSTGGSYHVVSRKKLDDVKCPILGSWLGLVDAVWLALSESNGISYLRVTHNVKAEIVKV